MSANGRQCVEPWPASISMHMALAIKPARIAMTSTRDVVERLRVVRPTTIRVPAASRTNYCRTCCGNGSRVSFLVSPESIK